jgi:ribosomal protein S18 acetylase RimI-like enzyme
MAHPATVRPAGDRDREAILGLWLELIAYHRRLDPQYPVVPGLRKALGDEIDRGLQGGPCRMFVADLDGDQVGFVFAEIAGAQMRDDSEPGSSWIHEIYVAPEQRDRGLGSALVEAAQKFIDECGGGRVAVRVESGNKEGLRFWQRHSYVERARILEKL